jgi:metal-responsive CopG/Arc/MetJ family transcriptional regulator
MSLRCKFMVSLRLPASVLERIDFVTHNIGSPSRTAAIADAIEQWLSAKEALLRGAGLQPPKRK